MISKRNNFFIILIIIFVTFIIYELYFRKKTEKFTIDKE